MQGERADAHLHAFGRAAPHGTLSSTPGSRRPAWLGERAQAHFDLFFFSIGLRAVCARPQMQKTE
eukprot:4624569-Alexandrium_andersonii.AAC.1